MKIAIYARQVDPKSLPYVEILFAELLKAGCTPVVYQPFFNQVKGLLTDSSKFELFSSGAEIRGSVEFLFSIGGDGTILDTLTLVQNSEMPVLGINIGRLGFLSSISKEQITVAIEHIVRGQYSLDKRSLLRLESNKLLFGEVNYALNELTIHKKDSSSMIIINTYLNGEYLNSYWADGLIISTPTGSTGYSLSCGGPIIVPHSENFVLTPIAPHNLNVRPIVVSDKHVISLEVEGRSQYFLASLDSRSVTIDSSIQLAVRKEDFTMNLVRIDNDNFLGTLRTKLKWGLDSRN
ncbi:MAG: NAD kinase [Bacteroidota bacterium]